MPTYEPPEPKFHIRDAGPVLIEAAKRLYAAYTENAHNLNYQGLPCPAWDDLTDSVRSHWCAVASRASTEEYLRESLPPQVVAHGFSRPPVMVARFVVDAVEPAEFSCDGFALHASAAIDGEANKNWSKWTPSGRLFMRVTNPALGGLFSAGQHYLIHVTRD